VYNQYIAALAEYKLKTAQAEKQRAEALNDLATVRMKQVVIAQLERDLREYNRSRKSLDAELKRMAVREQYALLLLQGRRMESSTFGHGWRAYAWFESQAMLERGSNLFRIELPADARGSENFLPLRAEASAEPAPDTVRNALQLMDWMHDRKYVARRGSKAQECVAGLYRAINSVAAQSAQKLRERLAEIRKGTYDPWSGNGTLGGQRIAAANKIERVGVIA
jgi:hypothetical protein